MAANRSYYSLTSPQRRRRSRGPGATVIVGIIVILLFIVVALGSCAARNLYSSTVTFKVTDKAAVATSHNGHKYLIYTDKGTYEDTDQLLSGKFSSSDLYGQIKVGHVYTCNAKGIRVPLFSWYKNLISCREG